MVDAETGVNAISNPESYTIIGVEAVVYTRVVIEDQFEVFPIVLVVHYAVVIIVCLHPNHIFIYLVVVVIVVVLVVSVVC